MVNKSVTPFFGWLKMSDFSKNPMGNCVFHSNNGTARTRLPEQGPIFKKKTKNTNQQMALLKTDIKEIKLYNKKNQGGLTVIISSSDK